MKMLGVFIAIIVGTSVIMLSGYIIMWALKSMFSSDHGSSYIDEETEGYINGPNGHHR